MADTPPNTFAAGWNARCSGASWPNIASADFLDGWNRCDALPADERIPFNSRSAISKYMGKAA